MKKITGLILFFIFLNICGKAQIEFRPGFIIKNNGDTLNGLVLYSVDGKFDRVCRFKRFEIARDFKYTASSLKAFGFRNGRYFESKKTGNRKTFMECLFKGQVSLFVRPGKTGGPLFLESPATGFFRLARGMNRAGDAGTFSSYTEVLRFILENSGNTPVNLNNIHYNAMDVIAAIREAGAVRQIPQRAFYATSKVRYLSDYSLTNSSLLYKIGINAGYQILTLKITGTKYSDYFREADFNFSYRPAFGLYIDRKLSRRSGHASLELAVNYLEDSYYGYAESYDGAATDRNDIYIDFSAIQVPLYFKYNFGKHKIHPYFKAGAYKSFLVKDSYHRFSEHQFQNDVYSEDICDFHLKGEMGFQGGAGLDFNLGTSRSLGIDALYTWGTNLMLSTASLEQTTTLETSGLTVMMRINF